MKKLYYHLFLLLTITAIPKALGQCRKVIVDDYKTNYLGSATSQADMGWTGDISTCTPGTISAVALSKTLQRLNYYRHLVGLNDNITFDAAKNVKSQQAALMMLRNEALNHNPPGTWDCYTTDGLQGASQGNLAAGTYGSGDIDNWMRDNGTPSAGHRRWILAPDAAQFGYGSIKSSTWFGTAGALMVIGAPTNPYTTPPSGYIQYPVAGYMPKNLIPGLWSFGTVGNIGQFSAASVTVTDDAGSPVAITVNTPMPGYGNSDALVWQMPAINTSDPIDRVYTVTISNFSVNGVPQAPYTYKVVAIQPEYADAVVTTTGAGCSNGTATVSFDPGYKSILWSTGATTTSVSGLAPGNYSIQVTDKNNCTITKNFSISAVPAGSSPTPVISVATATSFCGSMNPTVITANADPSYSTFQWLKNGVAISGATNSSYTATTEGNYTLTTGTCSGGNLTSNTLPFIVYNNATIAPACTFTSSYQGSNAFGIQNFTFNSINHTSAGAGTEGVYVDNTCTQSTLVGPGQAYNFSLKPFANNQSAKIFIDFDNDGTFSTTEKVYEGSYNTIHTGSISIPSNAPTNIPLRVRVISDFSSAGSISSCHISGYPALSGSGQAEDYSIIVASVLPVNLISFNAKKSPEGIKLTWITATETNNEYFDIERSTNAFHFETIGRQTGQNTTSVKHQYSWTDHHLNLTQTFYRLKQVDFDGTFSYSRIISVNGGSTDDDIVLGPNPVTDYLVIHSIVNSADLYDLNGRMLQKLTIGTNDLSAYASGKYFIRYSTATGIVKYYFIAKQ